MATKSNAQKTAYYRRAIISPSPKQTLQQLLSHALQQKKKVKERLEPVDAAASAFRVIGGHTTVSGMLCGTVLTFERGAQQLVILDDPEATSLSIGALEPPKKGGVQQQYVPGVLFFVVFENHLAVVHTSHLKTSALEQHLAWLLRSQTSLLTSDQGIVLADEPKKATKDRIRKSHVKSIALGRPFMESAGDGGDGESQAGVMQLKKSDVSRFKPDSAVINLIKSILPSDRFSKLNLEEAVFDGNLEVWVEIRYPSRSRSQPQDTIKLIDDIAIALRDQDEDSVALKLADGTKIKGSDLKISQPVTLKTVGGVPQEAAFYQSLVDWITSLIRNGMVSS
ncbi:hypothetical protein KTD55_15405 [Burkholderia gladioli]|uniref:hypothetical protein n=1 Tax=Burkholderia gladioli TaxID=28095 RepID=UPI001C24B0C2|nr:hypothetical protein [Burkholderia gladioli]MBU9215444.1 hypothetical protein [Burkholderia gladioli]MDN7724965.1 hypothetical protein [Burkholderia gladioli]